MDGTPQLEPFNGGSTNIAEMEKHLNEAGAAAEPPPDNYGAVLQSLGRTNKGTPVPPQNMHGGGMGLQGQGMGMMQGQGMQGQGMGPPFGYQTPVYPPANYYPQYEDDSDYGEEEYIVPRRKKKLAKKAAKAAKPVKPVPVTTNTPAKPTTPAVSARVRPAIIVAIIVFLMLSFVAPKIAKHLPSTVDAYGKFTMFGLVLISGTSGGAFLGISELAERFLGNKI
jgi:hypothetical protein